ncbi:hypothetical protein Vafri_13955 [Volvox africanus]|uniref:Uncharacterized protein n=1 Tax=Volvox africanus TaxID=51714 RepID=A0A8J4F302_9CHLO|nr:hypothetical protein Vafri_13955 [Volvox africanus]
MSSLSLILATPHLPGPCCQHQDFIPTYTAELAVWPLFQAFNFTRIPVEHQLLAVNGATLIDACFLSWARSQEDWVATAIGAIQSWQDGRKQSPAAEMAAAAAAAVVVAAAPNSGSQHVPRQLGQA